MSSIPPLFFDNFFQKIENNRRQLHIVRDILYATFV